MDRIVRLADNDTQTRKISMIFLIQFSIGVYTYYKNQILHKIQKKGNLMQFNDSRKKTESTRFRLRPPGSLNLNVRLLLAVTSCFTLGSKYKLSSAFSSGFFRFTCSVIFLKLALCWARMLA